MQRLDQSGRIEARIVDRQRDRDRDVVDLAARPVRLAGRLGTDLKWRPPIRSRRLRGEVAAGLGELADKIVELVRLAVVVLGETKAAELLELGGEDCRVSAFGREQSTQVVKRVRDDDAPLSQKPSVASATMSRCLSPIVIGAASRGRSD